MADVIKVGIIDSGVSREFLRLERFCLKQAAVFEIDWVKKSVISNTYDERDLADWVAGHTELPVFDPTGHGTAIASILHRGVAVPAEFYVAKILDENSNGSSVNLFSAAIWLVDEVKVDYLNMSLGTHNFQIADKFDALTRTAKQGGCEIFSAAGGVPTLPSELSAVTAIGTHHYRTTMDWVKVDEICDDMSVEIFQGDTWARTEICTSYACPIMLSRRCNVKNQELLKLTKECL